MSGPLRVRARAAGMATALALLLGALAAPPRAAAEPMAVIVHPDTPVENMTLAEVRRVFLGERQYWNAETPVVLIVRAPVAPERTVVLDRIYRMSESQFKQYWIAKIFRAESATAPKVVYSNDMANELVTAIPGAIAFVDARDVRPGTKVIRVDGFLPGESGYPLR